MQNVYAKTAYTKSVKVISKRDVAVASVREGGRRKQMTTIGKMAKYMKPVDKRAVAP